GLAGAHRFRCGTAGPGGAGPFRLRTPRPRGLPLPAPGLSGAGGRPRRHRRAECRQRSGGFSLSSGPAGFPWHSRSHPGQPRCPARWPLRQPRRPAGAGRAGTPRGRIADREDGGMSEFFGSVWWLIVSLGVLVTFHEFGHLWGARRRGVKVLRFSDGFGKPLWKRVGRDGTEYVVAALPLGGYVKM